MSERPDYALIIHGGAGPKPGRDYREVEVHLAKLIALGQARLKAGEAALNVVEDMVCELEVSGLYVAGRGSAENSAGYVELDAAIMDGARLKAGSVAGLKDFINPVRGARAVLENSPHVMLAGEGANLFCIEQGLSKVDDPRQWYRLPIGVEEADVKTDELAHGTVGAVALDREGRLASATSTGGLFGKRAGRVGDTPIIGSGTWADENVAISCTGLGEYFMLTNAAYDVAAQLQYGKTAIETATETTLHKIAALGGDGGMIAVTAKGDVLAPFNSSGIKCALVKAGQPPIVKVFG